MLDKRIVGQLQHVKSSLAVIFGSIKQLKEFFPQNFEVLA